MRNLLCVALALVLTSWTWGQQPPAKPGAPPEVKPSFPATADALGKLLESKVKAEWEAIKSRNQQALGNLLTDDFIAVESDGDGARNRYKAMNELASSFVRDYHLQLLKAFTLAPNVAFVKYESTMEFPPRAALRYKRLWISEIWVRQGDDWKLWRYQETPVK